MGNLNFGLNYNDPFENIDNKTVFDCRGFTISNDGQSLIADKGLVTINDIDLSNSSILAFTTTDKELVLFCSDNKIRRYNELTNVTTVVNLDFTLTSNTIKCTYSYNIYDELIIVITQYSDVEDLKIPLYIINLDNPYKNQILHEVNPYTPISNLILIDILNEGQSIRKGSYDFYIRFKLDSNNYTSWKNVGHTIYVSGIEDTTITSQHHQSPYADTLRMPNPVVIRPCNSKYETVNKSIKLELDINDYLNLYSEYQLAYINTYNNKVESYIVNEYDISKKYITFNGGHIDTISIDDLIIGNTSIYNVKALCNYNNRLYVANYEEDNVDSNLQSIADKVYPLWNIKSLSSIKIKKSYITETSPPRVVDLNTETLSNSNSLFNNREMSYDFIEYFNKVYAQNINADTKITLWNFGRKVVNNTSTNVTYPTRPTPSSATESLTIKAKYLRLIINDSYVTDDKISGLCLSYVVSDIARTLDYNEVFLNSDSKFDIEGNTYDTAYKVTNLIYSSVSEIYSEDVNHDVHLNVRSIEPNELYNFFIHYIDGKGNTTKGFKINSYGNPDYLLYKEGSNSFNITSKVRDINNLVDYLKYYNILKDNELSDEPAYNFVNNAIVRQIGLLRPVDGYFGYYVNGDGNKLFKAPDYLTIKQLTESNLNYSIGINFENIDIPTGYIGVTFSYEKVESSVMLSGITTYSDSDFITPHTDNVIPDYRFLASELLLNPSLITGSIISSYNFTDQILEEYLIKSTITDKYKKCSVMSKEGILSDLPYIASSNIISTKVIPEDSVNNRGRELVLNVVSKSTMPDSNYKYNTCQLLNYRTSVYSNKVKTLVPLGYNKYISIGKTNVKYVEDDKILLNLPSFNTDDYVYTYNKKGIIFKDLDPNPYANDDNSKFWINNTNDFQKFGSPYRQVSFKKFSKFYIPAENFISEMQTKFFTDIKYSDSDVWTREQIVLTPSRSSDIIKIDDSYILKSLNILDNYDDTKKYLNKFSKYIRRSDVLANESVSNSWSNFRPDNYSIINEQKGSITNLVGLGYYLLVHCEKSLFAYNKESTINADNQSIQLGAVDTFDLPYQEIFTSDKGICGLQDYFCNCVADGKYMFYDHLHAGIYIWDNGSINMINKDIDSLFFYGRKSNNSYIYSDTVLSSKRNNIMLFDRINKRVLITLSSDSNYNITFDYSLLVNKIVSYHVYTNSVSGCSTYQNGYYLSVDKKVYKISNAFNLSESIYDKYIDILLTDNTNVEKVINYLRINTGATSNLYLADKLIVYSNTTCTGLINTILDSDINDNYKKPYYDNDAFNFNWLYNSLEVMFDIPTTARLNTSNNHIKTVNLEDNVNGEPIHGKWFVIRLVIDRSLSYELDNVILDYNLY